MNQHSYRAIICLLVLVSPMFLYQSCGNKENDAVKKFQATGIEVEISNKNSLVILLSKDGTINRKGSGVYDSTDKDFFMGVTKEKLFDSLMQKVPNKLLSYCNTNWLVCDTTKPTCKVTVGFDGINPQQTTGFVYCVDGTMDNLPAPIKEYIADAISVTERWYQDQKRVIKK